MMLRHIQYITLQDRRLLSPDFFSSRRKGRKTFAISLGTKSYTQSHHASQSSEMDIAIHTSLYVLYDIREMDESSEER